MNLLLTVFDGEEAVLLNREDLVKYTPHQLVETFEATAVYRDLINDFIEQGITAGISISGRKLSSKFILQVERGFIALYERMEETFGQDSAALIWANVANAINLEKCKD